MKAVRVLQEGASHKVQLADVPKPQIQPGELLIKIRASSVQPSDILNSQGSFAHTTFPRTLGRDFAGTVVDGPAEWVGQDVFGTSGAAFSFSEDGAQAEFAAVRAGGVAAKPGALTFAQAAALGTPLTTAALTLRRAALARGDAVMVLGATGAVGSLVAQIARARGCDVVVGVGRHGTDIISTADPELRGAVEMTGGNGPDVVVDTVGDLELVHAAVNVMASKGRFAFITAPRGGKSTLLPVDLLAFYRRRLAFVGCNSAAESQEELAELLGELTADLEAGKIKAPEEKDLNLIGIDDALDAYNGKIKKAVIVFD